MHKFPIFNYSKFKELPLEQMDALRFSIYVLDFNWNYLFVNAFACNMIKRSREELLGKNMWEVFPVLEKDPSYMLMRKNAQNGHMSDISTVSPVTRQRVNIKDYRLEDCYYFSVSVLPNKESLMDELRDQLEKTKAKPENN
ncbi:PAS domain-containing protein [Paradesertivirga mongoliensis]|uniref:PAS domain-containing protein n=1 Tax=Paradesertivirga mongoliensis TaxID=2100740 RepID=A0ABW4ZP36_9SPHI|nr:PAS domain-containing protein [Pedobacter mongoliensis]